MVASDFPGRVSLAELVATLSLVADLGMGRPVERVLRQTVIAMRLGAVAGLDQATCASAYYTSLLTWVGCAAETSEVAALFGDETELYADTRDEDLGGVSLALFVARHRIPPGLGGQASRLGRGPVQARHRSSPRRGSAPGQAGRVPG